MEGSVDYYVILLRIIHVFAGVFWAGGTFFFVSAIAPAIRLAGPDGGKFMQHLAQQGRMALSLSAAAVLSAASGLLLYWRTSGHLNGAWITSGPGLALTIGGASGLVAATYGAVFVRATSARMGQLARQIHASGGPPSPEQQAEAQQLGAQLGTGAVWTAGLLVVALLGMSMSQYLFAF